ncbi:MAG: hypothetical protein ACE5E9_01075 [Nitrospinaceae bacterium]
MKKILFCLILISFFSPAAAWTADSYRYQLYKNSENFGIVVFPMENIFAELDNYIQSIPFEPVETGKAVMRFGSKGQNETYMMPPEVQKKYSMEKFIVLQILGDRGMLVGIYDPDWGLTLPSPVYQLDEVKKNISKTLNIFRGTNPLRKTLWTGAPWTGLN